ncbi:MAG TPA: nuclear transport factor 2 family protein [Caulobacteraceae bacterium]|jgi:limonene-1,2-epoxide hydrolase
MAEGFRTRRDLFGVAGALGGAAGLGLTLAAGVSSAQIAPMSEAERANLKLVDDFCASWPAHDLARIMAFFSDNPAYRQTEMQAPVVGREAVTGKIDAFFKSVVKFEVHESWARGPMVINRRTDTFTGRLRSWQGVGVFLVKDSKIVEWYDYTIERQLA